MAASELGANGRSLIHHSGQVRALLRERLWLQVLIGMAFGIATGLLLSPGYGWVGAKASAIIGSWLSLPGQAFLAAIKFVVIPLVLASVIRGIAAGDNPEAVGKIGIRTVIFFLLTTVCAVVIGLVVAILISPGSLIDPGQLAAVPNSGAGAVSGAVRAPLQLADMPQKIVALVPTNLLTSLVQGEMLHIVIGAAIVGIAILALPANQANPILDLLGGLQAVCMVIVKWVLRFAPFAVFGLMADISARVGLNAISGMAAYVGTVVLGLVLLMVLYLLIVLLFARRSPVTFLRHAREALLLAFSTSSSAAVMPLSLQTAESKLMVPTSVARFVIPLGTTINMGGTALYQVWLRCFSPRYSASRLG